MIFYNILWFISNLIAELSMLLIIYCIYDAIKQFVKTHHSIWTRISSVGEIVHTLLGKYATIVLIVSTIALFITSHSVHQLVGIYDLRLIPNGTYCFYVEAIKNGGKIYTLPAQIRIETDIEEDSRGNKETYTYYYIEKVVFSNGGYLNTEEIDSVEINEGSRFYDDDDNEWEFILLNKHAYSPYIKETNNATRLDLLSLAIKVISLSFVFYSLYKYRTRK